MSLPTAAAPRTVAVSHCLLDAGGTVLEAEDAGRPYYAASTIKLHVLAAALRAADAGVLDLAAEVPATRTATGADGEPFTLAGDHLEATHPAPGAPITVEELLVRMIDRSSNEATNQVISLIGLDTVAATIAELALPATRVERLIGDASALALGRTNETSAADLARTLHRLLVGPGPLLAPASRALALEALRAQRIPVIGTALRDGVPYGSKSGWVDGYRHDVALVGDPDAESVRVLAVMTAGMDEAAADEAIRARVRALLPDLAR